MKTVKHFTSISFYRLIAIIFTFLLLILVKVFLFDIYKVPSSSMEPTILSGDILFVSKIQYGLRSIYLKEFIKRGKVIYFRLCSNSHVQRNDIIIFNFPIYRNSIEKLLSVYGPPVVKRCYAIPGDTVIINWNVAENKVVATNDSNFKIQREILFPSDSSLHWTPNHYGPLRVPFKGEVIELNSKNLKYYKEILLYENHISETPDSLLHLNNRIRGKYIFKHDYYFVVGDNHSNSYDSRFWGFVPYENIIGKATRVLVPTLKQSKPHKLSRIFGRL